MDAKSLQGLEALLNPPKEKDEEQLDTTPSPYATPGSIASDRTTDSGLQAPSKDIWADGEVSENQHYEYDDPRPQPEYDILFKQAVGAEDIFLGTGPKNPSTACCENLVVKIKLPDSSAKEIELDITDTYLDCRTPNCRLGLHLPHKVDSKKSKAKWISDIKELHISLLLDREYDFINQ